MIARFEANDWRRGLKAQCARKVEKNGIGLRASLGCGLIGKTLHGMRVECVLLERLGLAKIGSPELLRRDLVRVKLP